MPIRLSAALGLILLALPVHGAENDPPPLIATELGGREMQFFQTAVAVGQVQLYLGGLAKQRAETEQVKAMGDALLSTHAEEAKLLQQLAQAKGVSFASTEEPSPQQRRVADVLEKLTGPKFDKACMGQIVTITEQAATVYEGALQSRDAQVKGFATQMYPRAKEKMQMANKLAGNAVKTNGQPVFRGSVRE